VGRGLVLRKSLEEDVLCSVRALRAAELCVLDSFAQGPRIEPAARGQSCGSRSKKMSFVLAGAARRPAEMHFLLPKT